MGNPVKGLKRERGVINGNESVFYGECGGRCQ